MNPLKPFCLSLTQSVPKSAANNFSLMDNFRMKTHPSGKISYFDIQARDKLLGLLGKFYCDVIEDYHNIFYIQKFYSKSILYCIIR